MTPEAVVAALATAGPVVGSAIGVQYGLAGIPAVVVRNRTV